MRPIHISKLQGARAIMGFAMAVLAVSGCSAVGVIATNDPYEKLAQASRMENAGRVAVEKRLILEAMDDFEQRDDQLGLAEAYRRFAFYLRVNGDEEIVRRFAPSNQTPTNEDGRMDKSIEYFEKALLIFDGHGKHDSAANVNYNIAGSHHFAGRFPEACMALDRSLESHKKAMQANPNGVVELPAGIVTFEEFIDRARRESQCQ